MFRKSLVLVMALLFVPALGFGEIIQLPMSSLVRSTNKSGPSAIQFEVPVPPGRGVLTAAFFVELSGVSEVEALVSYPSGEGVRYSDQMTLKDSGSYLFDISGGIRKAQEEGSTSQVFELSFLSSDKSSLGWSIGGEGKLGSVDFHYVPTGKSWLSEQRDSEEPAVTEPRIPKSQAIVVNVHPNPFNPVTTISLGIEIAAKVEMKIYDIGGSLVKTICSEWLDAGDHEFVWNGMDDGGRKTASGVYFYRVVSGAKQFSGKMVLLK